MAASDSLNSKNLQKKIQLFKNSLKFKESAAGIVVQRVMGVHLHRILKPLIDARETNPRASPTTILETLPDKHDTLVKAIYEFNKTFKGCVGKGLDMLESALSIAKKYKEDGAEGKGCILIAWKTTFDATTKKTETPMVVGAICLHKFVVSPFFSTTSQAMGASDNLILHGERSYSKTIEKRNYFDRNTMYIDTMCSKSGGVGKLLVLNAIRWALMRNCTGLIALSYSQQKNAIPESMKIFEALKFQKIIPMAKFAAEDINGSWFFVELNRHASLDAILKESFDFCIGRGSRDTLVWRCPK